MAIVTVAVWDADGSRQLRQEGETFRVDVPGGSKAAPRELLAAVRRQLGFDVVLLRIGADEVVEVEYAGPATDSGTGSGSSGFDWQHCEMVPSAARRPDWHRPGWLRAITRAVDAELALHGLVRTGEPVQARHTSVTGMLHIPTDRFPVWLKNVLPIFAHEGAVVEWLSRIAPLHVPGFVAKSASWWLAREFPAEQTAPRGDFLPLLADLQITSSSRVDELRAMGCADRSPDTLPDAVASIARRSDLLDQHHRQILRSTVQRLDRVCTEVASLGIPPTIVHGDLTVRNVRWTGDGWFLFDWTDACVAHPFVDLAVALDRESGSACTRRGAEYGRAWSAVLPAGKVERALDLAGTIGAAHQIVTYQWILDAFEGTGGDPQGGAEMLRLLHYWTTRLSTAL